MIERRTGLTFGRSIDGFCRPGSDRSWISVRTGRLFAGLFCLVLLVPGAQAAIDPGPLFRAVPLPALLIEPVSGEIVAANEAATLFYGYPETRLTQMSIQQINMLTPEQVAAERRAAALAERDFFLFRHRLASGEAVTVKVRSVPVEILGRSLLFSVVQPPDDPEQLRAVTEMYQLQLEELVDAQVRELEQAERQERRLLTVAVALQGGVILVMLLLMHRQRRLKRRLQALVRSLDVRNRELARLSEVMAHHFQEPVRRIVSFAKRLRRQEALVADSDGRRSLDFMEQQAGRLSRLLRDVQRYLSIPVQARQQGNCRLDEVVKRLRQEYREAFSESSAVFQATEEPLEIGVAQVHLVEMLRILIDNALAYRDPDRNPALRLVARRRGKRVQLLLSDNGIGIAPEDREQVLGLFVRATKASEAPEGTGLGLAVLDRWVRQLGGQVRIVDGIDGGIGVQFDLPARESRNK
ncbi:MAG: sensor histidine kinase [Halothiobacillaceae bacterium]